MSSSGLDVFALYPFFFVQESHVQTKQVIFWDHRRDILLEFVHSKWFYIADSILSLINDHKTSRTQIYHLLSELLIFEIYLLTIFTKVVVSLHDASLKRFMAFCVNCSIFQPRNQETYSILTSPIDAFNIGTIFCLISLEYCTTKVDYLQFMFIAIGMQKSRKFSAYEEKLFHLRRLCDELLCWKFIFLETKVCLNIFNIWIWEVTPEEIEIFVSWILLDYRRWFQGRFILCLKLWLVSV